MAEITTSNFSNGDGGGWNIFFPLFLPFIYGAVTGSVGVLLLIAFGSLFLEESMLLFLLPPATGFNGLLAGYNIAERKRDEQTLSPLHQHLVSAILSLLFAVSGGILLCFLSPWIFEKEWRFIAVGTAVFALCTAWLSLWVGRWISHKSREIRK